MWFVIFKISTSKIFYINFYFASDVFYSKINKAYYYRLVCSSSFYTFRRTDRRNVKSAMIGERVVKGPSVFTKSVYYNHHANMGAKNTLEILY